MASTDKSSKAIQVEKAYVEIINIRLYNTEEWKKLEHAIERVSKQFGTTDFFLFQNKTIEGDWAVHIWRASLKKDLTKSKEAVCLSELFSELGLVHHSLWTPAIKKDITT